MCVGHGRATGEPDVTDEAAAAQTGTAPRGDRVVVQIVPRTVGELDGVADYARVLSSAFRPGAFGRGWLLSGDPTQPRGAETSEVQLDRVAGRSGDELAAALSRIASRCGGAQSMAVLVHYVNYGYATRGCPFWLIAGLRAWKRLDPRARLVAMFHELYASGPPWRSSFWLSPLQRRLARSLLEISDAAVTNREQSRRWLIADDPGLAERVCAAPVFSTLGEPQESIAWSERLPQMVVAGRSGSLDRAYGAFRDKLFAACRAMEIEEILDIGARARPPPSRIEGVRVSALGHLAPAQASAVLSRSRAGFLDYPSDYLGKSTVFAAYAAHGLVPVVTVRRGKDDTGLKEGMNYWIPGAQDGTRPDFELIATGAQNWYATHSIDVQLHAYAKLLRG
jgi:hypothetical protein